MRFTLTYSGPLPASSDAKRKHCIRQAIHPQLKELWRTHPALKERQHWVSNESTGERTERGILLTDVSGRQFASLVHPDLRLCAELDILLLRPEAPGAIVTHSGDIDNQLKTLFDALRQPANAPEVPSSWTPDVEESPLFCLLVDDKLITRVNVETDRLLRRSDKERVVDATIRVTVKATAAIWANVGLAS